MWQRDIPIARTVGVSRCTYAHTFNTDLNYILLLFGLLPKIADLMAISAIKAEGILATLLWKDMAYSAEIISLEYAQQLARHFVMTQKAGTKFFSNADWQASLDHSNGFGWTPFTDATYDGGVIAVGSNYASCIWFEDED